MNKDEFLKSLDERLQVINEQERKDIIDEYRMHIEMKMQDGKSEEEAIADFGNMDELVNEILDAYKINTNQNRHDFDHQFNHFMDTMFDGFKRFVSSFTSLDMDDVVKFIFEIFIILLLLGLLHIPFRVVASIGSNLLGHLIGFGVGQVLSVIWQIVIEVAYLGIFIILLVNVCTKRIKRYRTRSQEENATVFDDLKDSFDFDQAKENVHAFTNGTKRATQTQADENTQKQEKDTTNTQTQDNENTQKQEKDTTNTQKSNYRTSQNNTYRNERQSNSLQNGVNSIVRVVFQIFFCLFMIPFVGIMIGLCCVLGVMVVLSVQGLTLFGAYFIVIGALMATGAFISLLYRVLWRRGNFS
ncbi:MAG: DUF1700 domain-containing protein [Longicatena sp.]